MNFPISPWFTAGQILFDLYGSGTDNILSITPAPQGIWRLTFDEKAGRSMGSMLITTSVLAETAAIFPNLLSGKPPQLAANENPRILAQFFTLLNEQGRTDTEVQLNNLGQRSIGQNRDASIWMWLARKFFSDITPEGLTLQKNAKNGLFSLQAHAPDHKRPVFDLFIPRAKTPDMIDGLLSQGISRKLPIAQAFTSIHYNDESSTLILAPMLRLADGRVLARESIENQRYGRYYFLPDEGFLPVQEQKKEHTPLENCYKGSLIPLSDVPNFIKNSRPALLAEGNEIDQALINFTIKDLPDALKLSSFSMDDDWCYLAGNYGLGNQNISLHELIRARQGGMKYIAGKNGWLKLTESPLDWFHNLNPDRLLNDKDGNPAGIRLSRQELLKLTAFIPSVALDSARQEDQSALNRLINIETWQTYDNLPGVPEHLRDYQRNGLAWLFHLYHNRLGGVLADDMGLGKTHQALALLSVIQHYTGSKKRFLIVCPASVVTHWVEKIRNFYPDLDWYVHHGSNRDLQKSEEASLLITTYGIARRDIEELAKCHFEAVILDEIQQAKNKKTDVYNAAIRLPGRVVIGLTGTPLENSVDDLKALFDICLPGFLGSDTAFNKRFVDPIEQDDHQERKETLSRLLHPFLLRRTREQVLKELPDVIEDIRTCTLSDDQVKLYREMIASRGRPLLNQVQDLAKPGKLPYIRLLAVINYLKQICDHPCLVEGCTDRNKYASGKWDLFVELLDECLDSSIKVVVFSHYTSMLDIMESYYQERGIPYCNLRGTMPIRKRREMIDLFNNDPAYRIFSASLLAGGVGVDLTAAQAVIHYDRWWNAAREDQATARVHRMGQKHVVQVFKLVTTGTLEDKINTIIEKKRSMANKLIREDDATIIKRLSREELIELLRWE